MMSDTESLAWLLRQYIECGSVNDLFLKGRLQMGAFSMWHWLVVLICIIYVVGIVHIAVSDRIKGTSKGMWIFFALIIPIVPHLLWLIFAKKGGD
jgi:hypothetical protein